MARSRYDGSRYFSQVSAGSRTWPSASTTGACTAVVIVSSSCGRITAVGHLRTPTSSVYFLRATRGTCTRQAAGQAESHGGAMRQMSRRTVLKMLAGGGAAAVLAPGVAPDVVRGAEVPKRGGQVVVGLSQEPTVFNPLRPHIEVDRGVHFGLFDSLWRTDERGQFLPNLAVEIPSAKNGGISKNGLEYTVRLRKGVAWHDGKSFTARDVKFTWDLVMNPKFGAYTKVRYDVVGAV